VADAPKDRNWELLEKLIKLLQVVLEIIKRF
jgi:hypothetical protein